jgi:hypothetical protein
VAFVIGVTIHNTKCHNHGHTKMMIVMDGMMHWIIRKTDDDNGEKGQSPTVVVAVVVISSNCPSAGGYSLSQPQRRR